MMFKKVGYACICSALIGCGGSDTPLPTDTTLYGFEVPEIDSRTKKRYLDAINRLRSRTQNCGKEGIKPPASALWWNDALYKAAYEHSRDLAISNTFSHKGSGGDSDWTAREQGLKRGSRFDERIKKNGYTEYKSIGENIAKNQASIEQVTASWMNSPGHCANIMNPAFTEIGMAKVEKDGASYWTQNFAGR